MPARMNIARQESNSDRKIWAKDYVKSRDGAVLCVCCRCPVEGVQGSQPTEYREKKHITPFFRLTKNWEKNGKGHSAGCRFNVENVLVRLVDKSTEIKAFDQDAFPILVRHGKQFEFRIHILMEAWRWIQDQSGDLDNFDDDENRQIRLGTKYVRTGRVLRPYLRIAKAVLSLVARIQNQPELANWIVLKNGPHALKWHEYFYTTDQYCDLHNYLVRLKGQNGTGHKNDVPIAVVVSLSSPPFVNRRQRWQVFGDKQECGSRADPDTRVDVTPSLYLRDQGSANHLAGQELILVCAIPEYPDLRPAKNGFNQCSYIGMTLFHSSQWCKMEQMDPL